MDARMKILTAILGFHLGFSMIVEAATFEFYQDGFDGGGTVSGFFSGNDLNGDGLLYTIDGEITAASFHWSGNGTFASTSVTGAAALSNVAYFYPLGNGVIENTNIDADPNWSIADLANTGGGIFALSTVSWFAGERFDIEVFFPGIFTTQQGMITDFGTTPTYLFTNNPVIITEVVPIPPTLVMLLAPLLLLKKLHRRVDNRITMDVLP